MHFYRVLLPEARSGYSEAASSTPSFARCLTVTQQRCCCLTQHGTLPAQSYFSNRGEPCLVSPITNPRIKVTRACCWLAGWLHPPREAVYPLSTSVLAPTVRPLVRRYSL